MKVLWLCNIILPQIAKDIKKDIPNTGGWIAGLLEDLTKEDIEIIILFPNPKGQLKGRINEITYYGFSENDIENGFTDIIENEKPDIIHIFGTEYKHTLDMMNVCEKLNILDKATINIQGLVSIYSKHYFADLPNKVINGYTFRDFVRQNNLRQQKNDFFSRGKNEIKALEKTKNIIGRTDWDKACTEQINPNAKYHFCNETLRPEFYNHSWDINKCEKHSIFLSQCSYPIKGFHYMLEAMVEILKRYPNTHIYTTGSDPLQKK